MKFCSKCGIEMSDSASSCPQCETDISKKSSIFSSSNRRKLFGLTIIALLIIGVVMLLSKNNIENTVEELLENDLDSPVKIVSLYYNEEQEGCFVEFKTDSFFDTAAIDLNTKKIDYKTEFDYYTAKADALRRNKPIDEEELHKCNQKIVDSVLPYWSLTVAMMENNGSVEYGGWTKIK